jgi:hypothetical protein
MHVCMPSPEYPCYRHTRCICAYIHTHTCRCFICTITHKHSGRHPHTHTQAHTFLRLSKHGKGEIFIPLTTLPTIQTHNQVSPRREKELNLPTQEPSKTASAKDTTKESPTDKFELRSQARNQSPHTNTTQESPQKASVKDRANELPASFSATDTAKANLETASATEEYVRVRAGYSTTTSHTHDQNPHDDDDDRQSGENNLKWSISVHDSNGRIQGKACRAGGKPSPFIDIPAVYLRSVMEKCDSEQRTNDFTRDDDRLRLRGKLPTADSQNDVWEHGGSYLLVRLRGCACARVYCSVEDCDVQRRSSTFTAHLDACERCEYAGSCM